MAGADDIKRLVEPLLTPFDLALYDVEQAGAVLRVLVDRPGGVDLDTIADVTRVVSPALDDHDPFAGRYTLEVSSPGLERPLRTATHFRGSVGETVRIKTRPGGAGPRRLRGVVLAADDDAVVVRAEPVAGHDDEPAERRVRYADVERARTVFEWGPAARATRPAKDNKKAVS